MLSAGNESPVGRSRCIPQLVPQTLTIRESLIAQCSGQSATPHNHFDVENGMEVQSAHRGTSLLIAI